MRILFVKFQFFFLIFLCFLASCSRLSPEGSILSGNSTKPLWKSYNVHLQDVNNYVSTFKGIPDTKSSDVEITPIVENSDTIFFLVNYESGWELLTADTRAPRIVAMATDGNIKPEDLLSNPAAEVIYGILRDNMVYLKGHPEYVEEKNFSSNWNGIVPSRGWPQVVSVTVVDEYDIEQGHLTQTRWGQGSPWNMNAPYTDSTKLVHCYTGCIPVAMAQVLHYLNTNSDQPVQILRDCHTEAFIPSTADSLVLQSQDVTFQSYGNYWSQLPMTSSESSDYYNTVSTLMVHLGLAIGAKYYRDRTSAYMNRIPYVLDYHFSVSSTYNHQADLNYIADNIFEDLNPSILSIRRYENADSSSHAVVIDAAKDHFQVVQTLYRTPKLISGPDPFPLDPPRPPDSINGGDSPQMEYEYYTETSDVLVSRYVGINWGWDGSFMFSGQSPIWYNTEGIEWTVGAYTYSLAVSMVTDFELAQEE